MGNKIGLIISREYLTRVRKKSFLLTTILVPLVIVAFYAIIIAISVKDNSSKERLAILDNAGILGDLPPAPTITFISSETEEGFVKKYREKGFSSFLYIPGMNVDSPAAIRLHSPASTGFIASMRIERMVNEAIERKRLAVRGISSEEYSRIRSDINIETVTDTETGSRKSVAGVGYAVSFACGILIYMLMIIYGTQVMRGVSEEKTSRIAEVVVSSVKPFQLMIGKIIGIGAVGLTQFAIWILIFLATGTLLPMLAPNLADAGAADAAGMAAPLVTGLQALPLGKILFAFIFYFFGGYLLYASLFAAIGSMATDDQQDTQQLIFPVLMPIILGFVIMTQAINEPNSNLAVFGSIFPLTSPIVMMGRITYDIPVWQIAVSAALLIATFLFFAWLAGRIYRTGILMYGKKPRWKDMMRWAFRG